MDRNVLSSALPINVLLTLLCASMTILVATQEVKPLLKQQGWFRNRASDVFG
jgi:hypothetical protein